MVVALSMVLALLISLLAVAGRASAHAEMSRSAPRPTQTVGGVVDQVELEFRRPIRPHESNQVVLVYPDGSRRQTLVSVDGLRVRGSFVPLTEPGDYAVVWGLVDDTDNDWTTEEFPFTFDPSAAAPEWLGDSTGGGDGGGSTGGGDGGGISNTLVMVVIVAVAAALAGWLFWPRRKGSLGGSRRR